MIENTPYPAQIGPPSMMMQNATNDACRRAYFAQSLIRRSTHVAHSGDLLSAQNTFKRLLWSIGGTNTVNTNPWPWLATIFSQIHTRWTWRSTPFLWLSSQWVHTARDSRRTLICAHINTASTKYTKLCQRLFLAMKTNWSFPLCVVRSWHYCYLEILMQGGRFLNIVTVNCQTERCNLVMKYWILESASWTWWCCFVQCTGEVLQTREKIHPAGSISTTKSMSATNNRRAVSLKEWYMYDEVLHHHIYSREVTCRRQVDSQASSDGHTFGTRMRDLVEMSSWTQRIIESMHVHRRWSEQKTQVSVLLNYTTFFRASYLRSDSSPRFELQQNSACWQTWRICPLDLLKMPASIDSPSQIGTYT